MPNYEYTCVKCEENWEDLYNLSDPIPNCPECDSSENVVKLISLCAKGVVQLGLYEQKVKIKSDAIKMQKETFKNENLLANLVGENKYQNNVKFEQAAKTDRPKIKSSKKK